MRKQLNLTIPTIRNTLKLNISQAFSFNYILNKSDIPYDFNLIKNFWWRWYSEIFGFYYNRIKRTYCIWITTFLKKNLDLKMPFFFTIIDKNIKPLNKYKNYIFLYNCSLNNIKSSKLGFLIKKPNFELTKYHLLSESAKYILFPQNKKHRALGSFGVLDNEINMFFSSYNSNWNSLYNKNSIYKQLIKMPKNFMIIINNYNFSTSFFINSFDSVLNLYPQYYLNYIKNLNNLNKLNKIFISNNLMSLFKIKNFNYFLKQYLNYYHNLIIKNYTSFIKLHKEESFNILNFKFYNNIRKGKNINFLLNFNKKLIFFPFNNKMCIKLYKKELLIKYKIHKNKLFIIKLIKFLKKNCNILESKPQTNYINSNYFYSNNLKIKNSQLIQIKWITKFKKYNLKYFSDYKNKSSFLNFNNLKKSSKILWYFMYEEHLNRKIKNFISKLVYIILNNLKLIYNIYSINNIKYNLILNYSYIMKYTKLNTINRIINLNFYDQNFIKILYYYKISKMKSSKFIKLNLLNINYIKYIN